MDESSPKPNNSTEGKEKLSKKILVAEDIKDLQNLYFEVLSDMGYTVEIVENGKELLNKLFSEEKFDAVITDNDMSEMYGIDALEQIRKNPKFEKLPVILHSGDGDFNLEQRVKKLGAKYLKKPCNFSVLDNTLKEMFEKNSKE